MLHSTGSHSILNRKLITKEILFKYLHSKQIAVTTQFTKQLLIEKLLQYWKETFCCADNDNDNNSIEFTHRNTRQIQNHTPIASNTVSFVHQEIKIIQTSMDIENFPINQMSRKFAQWFYENLNANQLQITDFWRDVNCSVEFFEQRQLILYEQHQGDNNVLEFCRLLRTKYELFFNLNVAHLGTQGRIDCHGLVLVLSCGTLHKTDQMVGTFECVFGLSRDPFSDNNWKINQMNMRLHNGLNEKTGSGKPTLMECESLIPLLGLEVPEGSDGIG